MVVHRTTVVIIFGSPTKFLVVRGLPDYNYFDPCSIVYTQRLTDTFVSPVGRGTSPRAVVVEGLTFAAVWALGVVFAATHDLLLQALARTPHTLTRMAVTLAPAHQGAAPIM